MLGDAGSLMLSNQSVLLFLHSYSNCCSIDSVVLGHQYGLALSYHPTQNSSLHTIYSVAMLTLQQTDTGDQLFEYHH